MHMRKFYSKPVAEDVNLLPGGAMLQIISPGEVWEEVELGDL